MSEMLLEQRLPYGSTAVAVAVETAKKAHKGQFRKAVKEEYINHPMRVMAMCWARPDVTVNMVITAILHDVIEDCDITKDDIEHDFGETVAIDVQSLSKGADLKDYSRSKRLKIYNKQLSNASKEAKIVKMMDRLDNLRCRIGMNTKWVKRYCHETAELMECVGDADKDLADIVSKTAKMILEEI